MAVKPQKKTGVRRKQMESDLEAVAESPALKLQSLKRKVKPPKPKRKKPKLAPLPKQLSKADREFIRHKVPILMEEGKTHKQALGQAFGMLRQKRKKR